MYIEWKLHHELAFCRRLTEYAFNKPAGWYELLKWKQATPVSRLYGVVWTVSVLIYSRTAQIFHKYRSHQNARHRERDVSSSMLRTDIHLVPPYSLVARMIRHPWFVHPWFETSRHIQVKWVCISVTQHCLTWWKMKIPKITGCMFWLIFKSHMHER